MPVVCIAIEKFPLAGSVIIVVTRSGADVPALCEIDAAAKMVVDIAIGKRRITVSVAAQGVGQAQAGLDGGQPAGNCRKVSVVP